MTLSALGIFSAAGAGGVVAAGTYELIESNILGTAVSSVVFSSLATYASTYKHLQVRIVTKSASTNNNTLLRLNGDTATNYNWHLLSGDGSSVASYNGANADFIYAAPLTPTTGFGASVVDILDAYSTTKNKTVRALGGVSEGIYLQSSLYSGAWRSTSAITSVTLSSGVNFAVGSRFSIYGIRG
jgi:hypothetical protein